MIVGLISHANITEIALSLSFAIVTTNSVLKRWTTELSVLLPFSACQSTAANQQASAAKIFLVWMTRSARKQSGVAQARNVCR